MLIVWPWTHESYDLSPLLLSGGAGHVADCNKARNQLSPLCILGGAGYLRLGVLIQLQITSPWTYSHLWWSWHSLGFNEDANYPPYSSLGGAGYIWGVTRLQIISARSIGGAWHFRAMLCLAFWVPELSPKSSRICPPTLSTPSRKVSVLIRLWKQHSVEERT